MSGYNLFQFLYLLVKEVQADRENSKTQTGLVFDAVGHIHRLVDAVINRRIPVRAQRVIQMAGSEPAPKECFDDASVVRITEIVQPTRGWCIRCLRKRMLPYSADSVDSWDRICENCARAPSELLKKFSDWHFNMPNALLRNRQVSDLAEESKNLAIVETRNEKAAGATSTPPVSTQILDYAWQMKKQRLAESTIKHRVYRLKHLVRKGANLMDPDSVLSVLATNNWGESNKQIFIVAYQSFDHLQSSMEKTKDQS